jgi:succinate dehydrogenase/fumarate reductase flavoprotein subunit
MTNYNSSNIKTLEFDALIIGGGGSGMRSIFRACQIWLKNSSSL